MRTTCEGDTATEANLIHCSVDVPSGTPPPLPELSPLLSAVELGRDLGAGVMDYLSFHWGGGCLLLFFVSVIVVCLIQGLEQQAGLGSSVSAQLP